MLMLGSGARNRPRSASPELHLCKQVCKRRFVSKLPQAVFTWDLRRPTSVRAGDHEKSPNLTAETFFLVAQVHSNWNYILVELSRWIQHSRGASAVSYSTAQY